MSWGNNKKFSFSLSLLQGKFRNHSNWICIVGKKEKPFYNLAEGRHINLQFNLEDRSNPIKYIQIYSASTLAEESNYIFCNATLCLSFRTINFVTCKDIATFTMPKDLLQLFLIVQCAAGASSWRTSTVMCVHCTICTWHSLFFFFETSTPRYALEWHTGMPWREKKKPSDSELITLPDFTYIYLLYIVHLEDLYIATGHNSLINIYIMILLLLYVHMYM